MRYIRDISLEQPDFSISYTMNNFALEAGLIQTEWKGERVFCAEDPNQIGCRFLKWKYADGMLHIEAWLRGVSEDDELDWEGPEFSTQKTAYKQQLERLVFNLQNPNIRAAGTFLPTSMPEQPEENPKAAVRALVFGILSIVFFFIPLLGAIFSFIAFKEVKSGQSSGKGMLAIYGGICGMVGLILQVVFLIL